MKSAISAQLPKPCLNVLGSTSPVLQKGGVPLRRSNRYRRDVILSGVVIEVGEAAETVIRIPSEYLDGLGDIAFALVTLDLVGGVEDVLRGEGGT
jgi:hypothetical protein